MARMRCVTHGCSCRHRLALSILGHRFDQADPRVVILDRALNGMPLDELAMRDR